MAIEFVPGAGWQSWTNLGGPVAGDVAAGFHDDETVEIFARRAGARCPPDTLVLRLGGQESAGRVEPVDAGQRGKRPPVVPGDGNSVVGVDRLVDLAQRIDAQDVYRHARARRCDGQRRAPYGGGLP
ncbi:hypothetical protein [Peterkaempfera sp. SMS 1(5)a]|uniref:hypothetical protein n=1 Tax=Peterkaempfera podocarpi TaxID=3232308 RepID=UPI0036716F69